MSDTGSKSTRPPHKSGCSSEMARAAPQSAACSVEICVPLFKPIDCALLVPSHSFGLVAHFTLRIACTARTGRYGASELSVQKTGRPGWPETLRGCFSFAVSSCSSGAAVAAAPVDRRAATNAELVSASALATSQEYLGVATTAESPGRSAAF